MTDKVADYYLQIFLHASTKMSNITCSTCLEKNYFVVLAFINICKIVNIAFQVYNGKMFQLLQFACITVTKAMNGLALYNLVLVFIFNLLYLLMDYSAKADFAFYKKIQMYLNVYQIQPMNISLKGTFPSLLCFYDKRRYAQQLPDVESITNILFPSAAPAD